jgi:dTDP-4-dehydrorhamnose reductase
MKLLILGGKGMAGHIMAAYFIQKSYEVYYTLRDRDDKNGLYLDVTDFKRVEEVIESIKPDVVINCVGILNEYASQNPLLAFQVNSLLPHQLTKLIERHQGKLIQISTDCVFSGKKGNYTEEDLPDGSSILLNRNYWGK